ncbi:MAG TPA: hypothetical protein PKC54_12085 [Ferruginibacter sp.]|nr:hypothetical protein [Ferruginibacter sp.]
MKKFLLSFLIIFSIAAKAQKVESIHVNLYTDSLKKGTFNYINIDGRMPNGRYIPLDSTHLIFQSSAGKFVGNNLWIDRNTTLEKIDVKVILRNNPSLYKEFSIYIKKLPDPELKTMDDLRKGSKEKNKRSK